jgi:hypothetical protein
VTHSEDNDPVITPATWRRQASKLDRTSTDLLNVVGWYGSTHAAAMWRKDYEFLQVFKQSGIVGFDPQVDDWDPGYASTEAAVLAKASVVVIRLENNELLNGSLGSIAEIGIALASAALRGQIVIVSIEDNLVTTLDEPGAIAQYMMLELSLEQLDQIPELTRFLQIHRGDDLRELAHMSCRAVEQQKTGCIERVEFDAFLAKKTRRSHNFPLRVLVGGSGGAYADIHEKSFLKKRDILIRDYCEEGQAVKILSEGAIAEAWKVPYGSIDNIGVGLAMRTLLAIETEFKQEADVLLLPIMAEAASKAACSEIGFLLFHALSTGQDVWVFLEPFDPVDYLRHQFNDVDFEVVTTAKLRRLALREAGVADEILAKAVEEEVLEAFGVFQALKQGQAPTYLEIRRSILGSTEIFHKADNIRRVRTLVQAHLENLAASKRFANFFHYSSRIKA